MFCLVPHFKVGDLVVIIDTLEWDGIVAMKGEVCIITKVYDENFENEIAFNYKVVLADGHFFDVWANEIVGVEDGHNI